MKKKKISFILLAVVIMFSLFGCGKKEVPKIDLEKYDEGTVLFDYYHSAVATPEDVEYSQMTLILGEDGAVYLHTYLGSRDSGTVTSHKIYSVPEELLTSLNQYIADNKIDEWNDKQYVGLDGAITKLSFRDSSGELVRVSTDNMPEDGEQALGQIASMMRAYITEDSIVIQ